MRYIFILAFILLPQQVFAASQSEIIEKLMQRIDQLEKKVEQLEQQKAPPASKWSAPAASAETTTPSVVGENRTPPPQQTIEKAVESSLVQRNAILLNPWTSEIEPEISYAHSSSDSVFINGFSIFPVLVVGSVTSEEIRRDTMVGTVSGRLGLPRGFQLDLRVPYQYIDQERILASGDYFTDSKLGLGDISGGISKELLTQNETWPNLIGRVSWKTASGDSVYDGDALGIGSGFNSVRGEVTALKILDPAAVYATLGYVTNFEDSKPAGKIDLGDSFEAALGTTIALNRDLAFSLGVQNIWSFDSTLNGADVKGSGINAANFNFGLSYEIMKNRRLDFSASNGLTRDAPDYTFVVSMPFRFE